MTCNVVGWVIYFFFCWLVLFFCMNEYIDKNLIEYFVQPSLTSVTSRSYIMHSWYEILKEVQSRENFKKELFVLSLFSVPHDSFWPDLPKSLAKISQRRPENRKGNSNIGKKFWISFEIILYFYLLFIIY